MFECQQNPAVGLTLPTPSLSEDEASPLPEDTSLNDTVLAISQALGAGHLKKAMLMLKLALESFHRAEVTLSCFEWFTSGSSFI